MKLPEAFFPIFPFNHENNFLNTFPQPPFSIFGKFIVKMCKKIQILQNTLQSDPN